MIYTLSILREKIYNNAKKVLTEYNSVIILLYVCKKGHVRQKKYHEKRYIL